MRILLIKLSLLFFLPNLSLAQEKKDTSDTDQPKKKYISDLLKEDVVSDKGLFTIHQQEGKLLFEIPSEKLDLDMLLISRIAKIPTNLSPYLNAGSKTGEQVVFWQKKNNQILLRVKSFQSVSDSEDPINLSVQNNNFEPIIAAFKVMASNEDSTSYMVDVTKLFTSDVKALTGMSSNIRKIYKVKGLNSSTSLIDEARSFPINIEVQHITSFNTGNPPSLAKTEMLSLLMNQSFILLPEDKMQPRMYDERVGWFTIDNYDYSSDALKADNKKFIRRWRLEPKNPKAYLKGKLVEPVKPIVFYLDPATPKKWVPYFKQGVEDWNECFETAGFKNAVICKEAPTKEEDPEFSPEDARYSVVRYVASTTRNAMGPSVSDPRTGEILESDIIWYHNHLRSYRNRYLLETGAANPKARTLNTPESEIGEMIRRVISHEVGHALGLPHNMKASAAYPVESLRDGTFTQKYGIATTIMDYARYNYVAQPGDKNIRFIRQIGPYDHYSVDWGYRYTGESTEAEFSTLQDWIEAKANDPMYSFGGGYPRFDPRSQTECIGDDNILATQYGLKNLRIVAQNLINWTSTPGQNYDDLEELYGEFLGVWQRYIGHVVTNVAGVYETLKTTNQGGDIYELVPREIQKEAFDLIVKEAFQNPKWLIPAGLAEKISYEGALQQVSSRQARVLNSLLSEQRLIQLSKNEFTDAAKALPTSEFLQELNESLLSLDNGEALNRRLQRHYIDRIIGLLKEHSDDFARSDGFALLKALLKENQNTFASKRETELLKNAHWQDLRDRIKRFFETP